MKSYTTAVFVATVATTLFTRNTQSLLANGETDEDRYLQELLADDVGVLHNNIMKQVNDRLMEDRPEDYNEYTLLMAEQMEFLCHEDSDECKSSLIESIVSSGERRLQREEAGDNFSIRSIFPNELADETKGYFEAIHNVLLDARDQYRQGEGHLVDLNEVSSKINDITDIVEKSDAHHGVKTAIKSVGSIASNSLEYWTEALHDKQNSFRRLHEEHHRSLQFDFNPVDIAISDFIGGVVGSIDPLLAMIFGGQNNTVGLIFGVVGTAASDSLAAAGVVYYPGPAEIVRCFLEGLLQGSNCTIPGLFFNTTGLDD